jgi:AcrR family transcriptional regulator
MFVVMSGVCTDKCRSIRRPVIVEEEPRMSRRDRRHRDTREEILAVARELLFEVGPEALSLRQVARRADFSPAALYNYFASRDEIVASLFGESFEKLNVYLERVSTDLPVKARIVELGMAYLEFGRENPMDLRCVLLATSHEGLSSTEATALGLSALRIIGDTVQEGIERGLFAPDQSLTAAELAYGVWALVHGLVSVSSVDLSPVADVISADARRVLEAFVSLLIPTRPEQ